MYRLINIQEKNLIPYYTSDDFVLMFEMLAKPEYKYKEIVIVDENGEIRGGKNISWHKSKQIEFQINNKE